MSGIVLTHSNSLFSHSTAAKRHFGARFGPGNSSSPIYLAFASCNGAEANILRCPSTTSVQLYTCTHARDAGVTCFNQGNENV